MGMEQRGAGRWRERIYASRISTDASAERLVQSEISPRMLGGGTLCAATPFLLMNREYGEDGCLGIVLHLTACSLGTSLSLFINPR